MEPITWTVLEFETKDRHPDWIWYAGLVAVIVAIVAIFYGNTFFGIFALVAGAVVIIYALRPPKMLTITIQKDGVAINEDILQVKQIKQFWLDETDKQDKLLLLVRGTFLPRIAIPLEGISAETIRSKLLELEIPEVEMRESTSVKIFDRLGF